MLRTLILDVEVSTSTESPGEGRPGDLLEAMAGWLAGGTFTGAAVMAEGL